LSRAYQPVSTPCGHRGGYPRKLALLAGIIGQDKIRLAHDQGAGRLADAALDRLVTRLELEISACTGAEAGLVREAWRRFGRGRQATALNFGDLFSYALPVERRELLLFTGEDFAETDVELVRW